MGARPVGRRLVLQAAALAAAGSALARVGGWPEGLAFAQQPLPTYDVLNLALTSEFSMLEAYRAVLEAGALADGDKPVIEAALADTQRNVERMQQAVAALNAQPVDEDEYTFPADELADRERALQLLLRLENVGTSGWIGAQAIGAESSVTAPELMSLGVVVFLGRARRAAAVGMLLGERATPFAGPFEAAITIPEAFAAVEQYRGGGR